MAVSGRYIVMLGYAGARIALTLAELHREEVQKRFPKHFLKQEAELCKVIKRLTESPVQEWLQKQHWSESQLIVLQEHEVFPSLWKLAEGLDAGLDVELGKIPVLQFVIEVSELYDVNPYVNMTALENRECFGNIVSDSQPGYTERAAIYSMLVVTDNPEEIIAFANENKLPAAVIGRLNDKNDRIVRNGEIIRYLTPEG